MIKCPKCKSPSRLRVNRRVIQRLIYKSRAYACDCCNSNYLYIPSINFSFTIKS